MYVIDDAASQGSVKQDKSFNKRIIRYVRWQRVLYDPAHPNFGIIEAKVEAWEKIAKQMRCDVDICKNAWVNLRFCYQKYVRRLRKFLANKGGKKRKRRPVMAFETEMVFLWRFIADKTRCRLPYDDANPAEKEMPPVQKATEDDDIVLLEDDVEVIDLDDDAANSTKLLTRQIKCQFQITPEVRRLVTNIEPYDELYDSDHRYYDDYRRKGIIWNAIANEVGDKGECCT
ncbi:PREDICTED: uncharacterized protein LOC108357893 [Rhagoletis zephyria]|uniref:uncharacterized protein LOC108357893 n=1 Tax=Rhagoletis zephyria TaxID=28612 RepID=UPI00081143B8|nr:PREDICTED: uncharacterized protein LOC108357893 [Rhagoletis zephyria]